MFKFLSLTVALPALVLAFSAQAAQFTIRANDICTTASCSAAADSYVGAGGETGITRSDFRGTALDGGFDAYDLMGSLSNLGVLTAQRHTDTLTALNTQRWLDTITNNTSQTVSTTVYWWGNLGSDGFQTMQGVTDYSAVNVDGSDPYIAFVWGNNDFARDNMSFSYFNGPGSFTGTDWVNIAIDLTLNAGESTSLLFYTFLAKDLSNRSGDLQLALDTAAGLVENPYLAGLSAAEIAGIDNFGPTVPEPASLALFGLALAGLGLSRRRKLAAA